MQVLINSNMTPFPDTSQTQLGLPLAYKPTGATKPKPLNGTSWAPTVRYRTGAETIRWTLDLNNDGAVNSTDMADDDARDARRSPNPNDYELVREVWGDSTGGVAGNNGPTRDRVGWSRAGGARRRCFTVYLAGRNAVELANGPVPASRLAEIEPHRGTVVATSPTKGMLQGIRTCADVVGQRAEKLAQLQVDLLLGHRLRLPRRHKNGKRGPPRPLPA